VPVLAEEAHDARAVGAFADEVAHGDQAVARPEGHLAQERRELVEATVEVADDDHALCGGGWHVAWRV